MKNKTLILIIVFVTTMFLYSDESQEVRVSAQVESRCKLTLSTNFVSFTRVNPDVERFISQNEPPLEVIVKTTPRRGESVYLRIKAEGDLIDERTGQKIGVKNISWKVSGEGFRDGYLSSKKSKTLGRWNSPGVWIGTVIFNLENKPDYAPGTYHLIVTVSVSSF